MRRRDVLKHLLALGAATAGAAVDAGSPPTNPADRRAGLEILRRALGLPPGLHRYSTPAAVEERLRAFEPAYLAAPDLASTYLLLSRFTAAIRCGHTYANFYNQRRAVAAELFDRPTRLPFEFRWIDGSMVVTRAHPRAASLVAGSVVETVNGRPAADLLRLLLPLVRADGGNDGKRRALLAVQGGEDVETFDVFHGLVAPPAGETHVLVVRPPRGARRTLEVPALTLDERRRSGRAAQRGADPWWTWEVREDGIAVLTMSDWAMYSSDWKDWRSWLDERLTSARRARGLVVDLRANEGGEDVGDEILARLAPRDLVFDGEVERVRFRRTPPDLDPFLDTWDDRFRTLGEEAIPSGDGFYELRDGGGSARIAARGPRLDLPVAVLVGPVNSSATFRFARQVRTTGLARLFGAETGGNRRGTNGGAYFFVRLPATGLEFDVPLIGYFPRTPEPDAGIVPDVVVADRAHDVARGRDPAFEAAVAWLRG